MKIRLVILIALLVVSCSSNQHRDSHGHRLKYQEAQKDKKRKKMLKKRGYPDNVFKKGEGGYPHEW